MNKENYRKTGTILDAICQRKIAEIAEIKEETYNQWKIDCGALSTIQSSIFKNALSNCGFAVISEIKKASPSESIIRADVDVEAIAKSYSKNGAAAISVVTDRQFFHGDISWIKLVKNAVSLPVLRKDFILDEKQVYESKIAGADAVLLIAAILNEVRLKSLHELATGLGMEILVEIRSQKELKSALAADAAIIGVNNRNLKNFSIDKDAFVSLVGHIPEDKIVVAESGINSAEDVQFMRAHRADAVLIGTHLMRADDPGKALHQLIGVSL